MTVLTFMSIVDSIKNHVDNGRLHLVVPLMPEGAIQRQIYAARAVVSFLESPWLDEEEEERAGRLRQDLDHFSNGEIITFCTEPFKARTAYMGLLDPPNEGIIDIRSRDPSPAIRVLGKFAERDLFIALIWRTRNELGSKYSSAWSDAYEECNKYWQRLFPDFGPVTGANVHDYIGSNVIQTRG